MKDLEQKWGRISFDKTAVHHTPGFYLDLWSLYRVPVDQFNKPIGKDEFLSHGLFPQQHAGPHLTKESVVHACMTVFSNVTQDDDFSVDNESYIVIRGVTDQNGKPIQRGSGLRPFLMTRRIKVLQVRPVSVIPSAGEVAMALKLQIKSGV
ncbi:MAG: hypothetical protein WC824_14015 [Bacteroidota bacterium]|jgi:hypothetical protein